MYRGGRLPADGVRAQGRRLVAAGFCVIIPLGLVFAVADLGRQRRRKDDQCRSYQTQNNVEEECHHHFCSQKLPWLRPFTQ